MPPIFDATRHPLSGNGGFRRALHTHASARRSGATSDSAACALTPAARSLEGPFRRTALHPCVFVIITCRCSAVKCLFQSISYAKKQTDKKAAEVFSLPPQVMAQTISKQIPVRLFLWQKRHKEKAFNRGTHPKNASAATGDQVSAPLRALPIRKRKPGSSLCCPRTRYPAHR